ncbi:Rrf2 family transcriptional regulator [Tenacibaculum sp. UWU-22]|uniref:RrF2 family transcriptional regulator n=1 Tax=Tenacibaculum sp. UWU-22 TaxID=3234187 RepID=UPI0034DAC1AE
MFTRASKNGIRSVLFLANNSSAKKKLGAKFVAEKLEIPAPFLAKILQKLSKNDIISSVKGPHGGFYLNKENTQKTLLDVILCIDQSNKLEECFLGQLECNNEKPCVVHHIYKPFKKQMLLEVKTKTIAEVAIHFKKNRLDYNDLTAPFKPYLPTNQTKIVDDDE